MKRVAPAGDRRLVELVAESRRGRPLSAKDAVRAEEIAAHWMEIDAQALVDPYMHAVHAERREATVDAPPCGCSYCVAHRDRRANG